MIEPAGNRAVTQGLAASVLLALTVVLSACGGGGGANGQVGDCAKDASGNDDVTVVACGDADAKYKIVGIEEGVSSGVPSLSCQKYQNSTKSLWYGKKGSLGRVLCLQELQKT